MRVFLTGATGFLGRALTLALRREGHSVVAWVRSPEKARAALGDQAELVAAGEGAAADATLRAALESCDAAVNLAGEPVLSRWTDLRKEALRTSRVDLTQRLVRLLADAKRRPRVLLSGSAVGFYGDRGDTPLDETSAGASGFLPQLCADWEAAALAARPLGVRVALVRTGVVLGLDGGALPTMLPPFRFGLGGRLASGRQMTPWIHVEDWVRLAIAALTDERYEGPINATAPEPLSNRDYTRELATALRKPAPFPVPALVLRLLFGGAASILLESQRALPRRALDLGFTFRFATLTAALRDLLVDGRATMGPAPEASAQVASDYLRERGASHQLTGTTTLPASLHDVWRFFSNPENLGLMTPRALGFTIEGRVTPPATGTTLDLRVGVGPLRLAWRTRFESWQPESRFVDVQERGPYRSWWHEHRFTPIGPGATRMDDRVLYAPPLGVLGRLAHRLFIADQLGDIFRQRALAIRLRFGE